MLMVEPERQYLEDGTPVPSLRSNFAWTFAGNVLYAGCQWGMLSVLAKLGSASIVGQFTLGLAIATPIFMFTNLQLRMVQATDVFAESGFADYFTLRVLATLAGLAAIAALLPFIGTSPAVRTVVFLVAVSKSAECLSDVTAGLLQRQERLKRVAISLIIRGACSVVVFSLVFNYLHDLVLAVLAMSAVWFAVFLLYDVPNTKALIHPGDGFFRIDIPELKRLVILSLPLGWAGTLASVNAYIPRYALQHYSGLADQGIYSSLAYLVVAVGLIVLALSQSVTTRLARLFAEGEMKEFVRLLVKLSALGVLIPAIGVPASLLVGRPVLTFLYSREYGDHVSLLALLVGTAGITTIAAFLLCGMNAARLFHAQLVISIAAVTVCALASAVLVPRYGLFGAGVAALISSLVTALGGLGVIHRAISERTRVVEARF
jgi:O-antigen/teichoic acid export membrane protein